MFFKSKFLADKSGVDRSFSVISDRNQATQITIAGEVFCFFIFFRTVMYFGDYNEYTLIFERIGHWLEIFTNLVWIWIRLMQSMLLLFWLNLQQTYVILFHFCLAIVVTSSIPSIGGPQLSRACLPSSYKLARLYLIYLSGIASISRNFIVFWAWCSNWFL